MSYGTRDRILFTATEDIPAYSVVIPDGSCEIRDSGEIVVSVGKPSGASLVESCWITGRADVDSGDDGLMFCGFSPILAKWSGATSPTTGDTWGPENNSFTLVKDAPGFRVLLPLNNNLMVVVREMGGSSACFGKLDDDLVYSDTTGKSVSVYSNPTTDSGTNIDNVLPPPWMTEGTIASGSWVEVRNWGGSNYAFPLPVVQEVITDNQVDATNSEVEEKTRKLFAAAVGTESGWTTWHTGDDCT